MPCFGPLLACFLAAPVALNAGAPDTNEVAPPTGDEIAEGIGAAVRILLANQERYVPDRPVGTLPDDELAAWQEKERDRLAGLRDPKGGCEWPYEGVYRVGPDGRIPPGYRVGGTAICCEALVAAPGFREDAQREAAVERSIDFMLDRLLNDPGLEPGPKKNYDVRGWGHTYALQFFLRAIDLELVDGERREAVEKQIPHLIHCIEVNALEGGGWNYGRSPCSPFMTAPTLFALFHAAQRGHEVDENVVAKALEALEVARDADSGAYAYSGSRESSMPSSAARAAVAELALLRAGRSDARRLTVAVEGFLENWEHLLARKSQQGTHKPPYGIAPYYFFFGHTYAGQAIEYLPEPAREPLRDQLHELLWRTRGGHGGWNDRVFPRTESYSTAMVILALCAPELAELPSWP